MIYRLFEGSIRYEDLSEIILKTNYNNIKSTSAVSRFFSKLKAAKILTEIKDFDGKKRFFLTKPALAYLRKKDYKKISSVSKKTSTLIQSNFKARYFIENYVDLNETNVPLEELILKAWNSNGNVFNSDTNRTLDQIVKVIGESNLKDETSDFIKEEKEWMEIKTQKQKESLKLGPKIRKKIADDKKSGLDPYEEFNGIPTFLEIVPKQKKKEGEKRLSLDQLKQNKVYLSDVVVSDVKIPIPYTSSITRENGDKGRVDYSTHFQHLQTQQITFKFVHFCSSIDIKTSRLNTLYKEVVTYSDNFKIKNDILKIVQKFVAHNQHVLERMDSSRLSKVMSNIKFTNPQLIHVVIEFDVIFMNEINFNRVKSKISKSKDLKNNLNNIGYFPNFSTKINFRHYNIYPMNEHSPT